MGKAPNDDARHDRPVKNIAGVVLGDIADTTWRMFVPTIGGALLGLAADLQLQTMPLFFLAGFVLGAILAGILVRRQLTNVNNS